MISHASVLISFVDSTLAPAAATTSSHGNGFVDVSAVNCGGVGGNWVALGPGGVATPKERGDGFNRRPVTCVMAPKGG